MRRYLAEFLAAFFLVFVGVAAIVADQQLAVVQVRDSFGPLGIALAHGLALAMGVAAVGRISGGHANPAVSLAFFVTGRISAKDMGGYIAAQLLGGLVAAFLVKGIYPAAAVTQAGVGAPALGAGVRLLQGISIEVVLTFFLTLVVWGVAVDRRGPKALAPIAIGLTVTFDILAGGPFTGAAMNPARWLGPAVAAKQFRNWPVWIVGPIIGAILASLLYEAFFLNDEAGTEEEIDVGEEDEELEKVGAESEWRDTPSSLTPPSGGPRPAGDASPMVPPPPPAEDAHESHPSPTSPVAPPPPPPPGPPPPPPTEPPPTEPPPLSI